MHSQDRSCGSHRSSAEMALHLDGVRIADVSARLPRSLLLLSCALRACERVRIDCGAEIRAHARLHAPLYARPQTRTTFCVVLWGQPSRRRASRRGLEATRRLSGWRYGSRQRSCRLTSQDAGQRHAGRQRARPCGLEQSSAATRARVGSTREAGKTSRRQKKQLKSGAAKQRSLFAAGAAGDGVKVAPQARAASRAAS